MKGLIDTIENRKLSGFVTTLRQYFENNPQSIHIINGNPLRRGVVLNGALIEIGSVVWSNIALTPVYHDLLFGELREISLLKHKR